VERAAGSRRVLAIDLGGTKVSAGVFDETGHLYAFRKAAVEKSRPEATCDQIAEEASQCVQAPGLRWEQVEAAGVIVPGIYNPADGSAWAPNLWGDADVPIRAELVRRIPVPIRFDSDRAGYVLGEHWLGAARGLTDVVFLAVGTGIGAGFLSGGRLIRGAGGVAGAVGWFALTGEFKEAYRRVGCWEAEAAGPAVAQRTGRESAEAVVEAARQGDAGARAALAEVAEYLAMGVANLVSALNPQMVVLGGGLMQAGDLLLEPIRRAVPKWAQPRAAQQVRIEPAQLGEWAGLFGAAYLALSGEHVQP